MEKMLNIGLGAIISSGRIVAMLAPDSAPMKRLITDAKERGMLIDATYGRRTRAVIIMDSGHVVLSSLLPDTLAARVNVKAAEE